MAKTKYFVKKGSKMADFLCIFCRNLKLMATPQFCKQSIPPALVKIRDSYLNIFYFQDTLQTFRWKFHYLFWKLQSNNKFARRI